MKGEHTGPAGNGRLIGVDAHGRATVEREGVRSRHPLIRGCRMACLGPDPAGPGRMILAIESGPGPEPADRTVLASISPDGVEALVRDMLAAVERHRAGRAIDMRYLT